MERVDEALNKLVDGDLFKNETFGRWYMENSRSYPNLCTYVDALDGLRYRVIDYINRFLIN